MSRLEPGRAVGLGVALQCVLQRLGLGCEIKQCVSMCIL